MNEKLQKLYDLAVDELTNNILPWWIEHDVDEEHGGFYGAVTNDNAPVPHATRFLTLNARLVWTFSAAYRVMGNPEYKKMADRAYNYFIKYFWDDEYNAANNRVDEFGDPVSKQRYIYGEAFAIYGLSEYARAMGCNEALEYARKLVASLEKHVYDPVYKGYFESCKPDWTRDPWTRGVNRLPTDEKTMNNHLHLIEAYTCLLRTDKSDFMQNKVREHLYVMLNKIVDHDIHHYFYFQARDWKPTTQEISFGHDIEGTWLMMETAEVLGEPEAMRYTKDTCMNMARACYEQGFRKEDGAMLSEYDPVTGHSSPFLSWCRTKRSSASSMHGKSPARRSISTHRSSALSLLASTLSIMKTADGSHVCRWMARRCFPPIRSTTTPALTTTAACAWRSSSATAS